MNDASRTLEVNFDGIVGPTHNYAGLSAGNLASQKHGQSISRPRDAALQGLAKMRFLADLGIRQGVLPPQERPDLAMLRRLGFFGDDAAVIAEAHRADPRLLASVHSASSMWAANAATVSPAADAADGRVHFTPANLLSQFHRSIEPPATARLLKTIFPDESAFAHHPPLPASPAYGDEGAANHMRLCGGHGSGGVEIFIHGRDGESDRGPRKFAARQTLEASVAIARLHQLDPARVVMAMQNPDAIDAGAFHNDVVAVSNENVLLYHAAAYVDGAGVMEEISRKFAAVSKKPLHLIAAAESQVSLRDAIETYLFNSQLVSLPDGTMALIAPVECRQNSAVEQFIGQTIAGDNPIGAVHYLDVRESMKNGGGPACLRLRVVLDDRQLSLVHPGVLLTPALYESLTAWVGRHYRQTLEPADLADPRLAEESRAALDELTRILGLGSLYCFQR